MPLERVDVGVQVAHLEPRLLQVVGEVLGHALRQRRDQHALALLAVRADLVAAGRPPGPRPGAPRSRGSMSPVGRMICSTTTPPDCSSSRTAPAWRETKMVCAASSQNSSKRSGRLSSAHGSRKPYSTSVCLRARSPWYIAADLRHRRRATRRRSVRKSSGKKSSRRVRPLARRPPVEVPRVVLDPGAVADLLDHLEVVLRARLQPLRLEQLARAGAAPQPLRPAPRGSRRSARVDLVLRRSRSASRGRSPVVGVRVRPRRVSGSTCVIRFDRRRRRTRRGQPSSS